MKNAAAEILSGRGGNKGKCKFYYELEEDPS